MSTLGLDGTRPRRAVRPRRPAIAGWLTRVAVTALIAAVGPIAAATTASADPSLPVTGIVVDQGDGTVRQSVDIARLYPRSRQSAVLLLDGDHPELARRMEIGVTSLADLEHDCIHPETATGDTSCGAGPDQGELSSFLDLNLTAGHAGSTGGHRTCQPVGAAVTTTLRDLAQAPVVVGLPTDDGTLCVVATFAHRDAAGDNVTQTDEVRFDLRLRFDAVALTGPTGTSDPSPPTSVPPTVAGGSHGGPDDDTEVKGVKFEHPVVVSRVERGRAELGALPRTGTSIPNVLIASAGLLCTGTVLLAVSRRRRRHREEVA